jgi:hypothetical protein
MKNREFTQEEILNSKAVVKPNRNYPAPAQYLEGLLNIQDDFFDINLKASHELINLNDDQTENISFNRFNIQYTFKIDEELQYNLGLIIALDKAKPIAKIYSGIQVTTCLNMCIFNADQKYRFDLDSDPNSYKTFFKEEFKKIEEKAEKGKLIIDTLKSINLSHERILLLNGAILEKVFKDKLILGSNPVINGIKLQSDMNSIYYAKDGLNAWLYYNSLTEYLDKKIHILDIPEKALEVFECVKEFLQCDLNQTIIPLEENKILEIGV